MLRRPILDRIFGRGGRQPQKLATLSGEELTKAQKVLAGEFRCGIAGALGVPEEVIRQEIVEKWIREWTRAMVRPEYLKSTTEMSPSVARKLGSDLGRELREALESGELKG